MDRGEMDRAGDYPALLDLKYVAVFFSEFRQ